LYPLAPGQPDQSYGPQVPPVCAVQALPVGVGSGDGLTLVGLGLGVALGLDDGLEVGELLGLVVGDVVGDAVGDAVGLGDGNGMPCQAIPKSPVLHVGTQSWWTL
jgi:hypothetical protein